jgi:replication factor C subunit 3/5
MDIVDENAISKAPINPKDSLPWVEKYRPNSLEELIAHEEIIQILNKLIESNKLPHLLFHGPPGTGMSYSSPKKIRSFCI